MSSTTMPHAPQPPSPAKTSYTATSPRARHLLTSPKAARDAVPPPKKAQPATASGGGHRGFGSLGRREDAVAAAKGTELVAAVAEQAEGGVALQESGLLALQHRGQRLEEHVAHSTKALDAVQGQYEWTALFGHDFESVVKRCQMEMAPDDISLAISDAVDPDKPRSALWDLRDAREKLGSEALADARKSLRPLDLNGARQLTRTTVELHEHAHTALGLILEKELQRSQPTVDRLLGEVAALKAKRDAALAAEDTVGGEEHHRQLMDVYVVLLDELNLRMAMLADDEGRGEALARDRRAAEQRAQEAYDEFCADVGGKASRTARDIQRSTEVRGDDAERHQAACNAAATAGRDALSKLNENANEQRAVQKEMERLAQRMCDLANERRELLDGAAQDAVDEGKRVAEHGEFGEVQTAHDGQMRIAKTKLDTQVELGGHLQDYLAAMRALIRKHEEEEDLEGPLTAEALRYLERYRDFVFEMGDLTTRVDLRNEGLQRQRRHARLQAQTAVDSLDPESALIAGKQRELGGRLSDGEEDLGRLRTVQDLCGENFKLVAHTLQRLRVAFEDPAAEYTARDAQDRQRFVDRTMDYITGEETAAEKSQQRVKQLERAAAEEREARHAQLKAASPARAARSAGSPGAQSPDGPPPQAIPDAAAMEAHVAAL